ncbi:hypothetical protein [Streptomyces sp. NPDC088752]|uniref:hypothetical protein n=1 Tax=Streptomyces sp. NPDC088752 TaxID=3154963 RepID=UPI00344914D2
MATPATTNAITPTFNFSQLDESLKTSPDADLGSLLTALAQIPAPQTDKTAVKKVAPAVAEQLTEELAQVVKNLPSTFNQVAVPSTRRMLKKAELAAFTEEKLRIAAAKKVLDTREKQLNEAAAIHFDVEAEKSGLAKPGETPVDKHGHYLVGGSSKELRQAAQVDGCESFFVREKSADRVNLDMGLLVDALQKGEITRDEFLALTSPVKDRFLDEAKIRRNLLSKARRKRTQEIITKISVVTPGTLSIKLRK